MVAFIALVSLVASVPEVGAVPCGPFGDAPAAVDHGWFASLLTRHTPRCRGGRVLGPWIDPGGDARFACLYEPASVDSANPLPLLVFLHGSIATADSIRWTGLVDLVGSADLGGKRRGFILLAPQGRYTTHFYPGLDRDGFGWDNWYRQLNPAGAVTIDGVKWPENDDAATIDHFIALEVAGGAVDRRRIYVSGWSNGAAMAILYALARPSVAAAAVYSAPDPFGAFSDACPQTPVAGAPDGIGEIHLFNPRVPIIHVRNACDIGGICPNGDRMRAQIGAIDGNIDDIILDASGKIVNSCNNSCGTDPMAGGKIGSVGELRGLIHHVRWPKAWNDRMISFLREHPLPPVQ